MLTTARKAAVAGALALATAVLTWNIPGWIDGSADFAWRSVAAGAVAAFIAGFATYWTSNAPK